MRSNGGAPVLDVVVSRYLRARRPNVLTTILLLSLAIALAAPPALSDDSSLFVSIGQGSTEVAVPVEPAGPQKILEYDSFAQIFVSLAGGTDLFGLMRYNVEGNFDPYFAARLQVTNVKPTPQPVSMSFFMPIQAVATTTTPPVPTFTGTFSVALSDTSGDGIASFTGGGAGFRLTDVFMGFPFSRPVTPNHSVDLTEPSSVVVYDLQSVLIPSTPSGQFSGIEFLHFPIFPTVSSLSPGDTVEYYVFGCVAVPDMPCPTPPALPLPEPQTAASLGAGFVLLAGAAARRRRVVRLSIR